MYRIHQIENYFIYDEYVVVTKFYTRTEKGELFCKTISSDKSEKEMNNLSKLWSLTTLSIYTDKTNEELFSLFGKSFKRCFVRYRYNSVTYDFNQKVGHIVSHLEVSLKDDFSSPQYFDINTEFSFNDELEKQIKIDNLIGYKQL